MPDMTGRGNWRREKIRRLEAERDALRAKLAEAHAENLEQARLLGISGSREAALQARAEKAERERDELAEALRDKLHHAYESGFMHGREYESTPFESLDVGAFERMQSEAVAAALAIERWRKP